LEEVISADIIVHVRDISHPESDAQREDVLQILRDLGVLDDAQGENQPRMVEIWNKLDLLDDERRAELTGIAARDDNLLMISAETGEGIDVFKGHLTALIAKGNDLRTVRLRADNGAALAWLHGRGVVSSHYLDGDIVSVDVSLSRQLWGQFEKKFEQFDA
jgi:GTP-binding protein HflX